MRILLLMILIKYCSTEPLNQIDVDNLKTVVKALAMQLEKFHRIYSTNLEEKLSLSSKLGIIETNLNNLQERARVWDNFDQHVTAWNAQMAILDRKMDIISKGQETMMENLDGKIGSISQLQYKIDTILNKLPNRTSNDVRAMIESIDSKIDSLPKNSKKSKFIIKCDSSRVLEKLRDVSSKVDVIYDRFKSDNEYEVEYFEDEQIDQSVLKKFMKKTISNSCKEIAAPVEQLLSRSVRNENLLRVILDRENVNNEILTEMSLLDNLKVVEHEITNFTRGFETILHKYFKDLKTQEKCPDFLSNNVQYEPNRIGCEDLSSDHKSGVYLFGKSHLTNENERTVNQRFCLDRNSTKWTVIQRRDDYSLQENFNRSWKDYKLGFGQMHKDFWFGNDFIHQLTENITILRIELEDFEGNMRWAEYSTFKIDSEDQNFTLFIDGFSGNLSDALSSDNGSNFITFDRSNNARCSSGWWFNNGCPNKVNLNGVYKSTKEVLTDESCVGILWSPWIPDAAFKRSLMMIRPSPEQNIVENTSDSSYSDYEDPYY